MTIAEKVWTEKFAEMSHGKTRYWDAGSGTPTILIHGAGWNSGCESWSLAMAPLSQQLRVLAIDCLNWGTGDVLDQEFSFAYLVDHVREFMDVLGIEQANVVGHSMGGWILTLLSYESPERVRRAVNVAGGGAATRPLQNMVEFKVPAAGADPRALQADGRGVGRGVRRGRAGRGIHSQARPARPPGGIRQGHAAHDQPAHPPALQHAAAAAAHYACPRW